MLGITVEMKHRNWGDECLGLWGGRGEQVERSAGGRVLTQKLSACLKPASALPGKEAALRSTLILLRAAKCLVERARVLQQTGEGWKQTRQCADSKLTLLPTLPLQLHNNPARFNPEQNNPGSVRETFISNSEGGEKQTRNGVSNLQCEIMRRICIYHELCLEKCCTQAGGEFAQGEFLGEHTLETGSRVNV